MFFRPSPHPDPASSQYRNQFSPSSGKSIRNSRLIWWAHSIRLKITQSRAWLVLEIFSCDHHGLCKRIERTHREDYATIGWSIWSVCTTKTRNEMLECFTWAALLSIRPKILLFRSRCPDSAWSWFHSTVSHTKIKPTMVCDTWRCRTRSIKKIVLNQKKMLRNWKREQRSSKRDIRES